MTNQTYIDEIVKLHNENMIYCSAIREMQYNCEHLESLLESWHKRPLFLRRLPLKFAHTSFFTHRNEIVREIDFDTNGTNSIFPEYTRIAAACSKYEVTAHGIIFYFTTPYICFKSQLFDMPEYAAKGYVNKILYLYIANHLEGYSKKEHFDLLKREIVNSPKTGLVEDIGWFMGSIVKSGSDTLFVLDIKQSGFNLYESDCLRGERVENHILELAYSYKNCKEESQAILDINELQNSICMWYGEQSFVFRESPTKLNVITRTGYLFYFYFFDGTMWFYSENKVDNPVAYDYFLDFWEMRKFKNKNKDSTFTTKFDSCEPGKKYKFTISSHLFRNIPNDPLMSQLTCIDKSCSEMTLDEYWDFLKEIVFESTADEERSIPKEKDFLDSLKRKMLAFKANDCSKNIPSYKFWGERRFVGVSRSTLEKLYLKLKQGNCIIRQKYSDYNLYYRRKITYSCYSAVNWFEWFCRWSNYGEWRGTFFDLYHKVVNDELLVYEAGCSCAGNDAGLNQTRPITIVDHEYYNKYSCLEYGESINKLEKNSFFPHDLNADYLHSVLGYCNSTTSDINGVSLHIIDPTGETWLRNLPVPSMAALEARGKICVATFGYNYFKEQPTLTELQILPYTLTEKCGEYATDTIRYRVDGVKLTTCNGILDHMRIN